eukprot:TRINITY_DN45274_c0_g1_i1.p2 TRINITY_DN45274_c0_g1~~TRINITY_DN45274_c0_g1_i1.p2  ORF type:complete len:161 (+),score=30.75 TRINITY_DN45274_c0_g1_i1:115-597(+)
MGGCVGSDRPACCARSGHLQTAQKIDMWAGKAWDDCKEACSNPTAKLTNLSNQAVRYARTMPAGDECCWGWLDNDILEDERLGLHRKEVWKPMARGITGATYPSQALADASGWSPVMGHGIHGLGQPSYAPGQWRSAYMPPPAPLEGVRLPAPQPPAPVW